MTPINLTNTVLPNGWEGKAATAAATVVAANDRTAAINGNAAVWALVKESLSTLSHEKCWYCEARRSRSDFAVDHFRPKNTVSVQDSANHPGYWWLAFQLSNYRFCCTFCNSKRRDLETGIVGGKQDRFPLHDETARARAPEDDLANELPLLLDPVIAMDAELLYFEMDGRAIPAKPDGTMEFERAAISISLYHLNHSSLKRARKRLYAEIQRVIVEGDVYFRPGPLDQRVEHAKEAIVRRVLSFRQPSHEYLAASNSFLSMFAHGQREWLGALIQ